jgi:hypothetical protein
LTVDTKQPADKDVNIPFIYAGAAVASAPFNFASIDGGQYEYGFEWRASDGNLYNYIGYLTFKAASVVTPDILVKERGSFYANLKVLPARIYWDYGPTLDGRRIYIGDSEMLNGKGKRQGLWIMGDAFDLSQKGDVNSIGEFRVSDFGIQAGYDLFGSGGLFLSYQSIKAQQAAMRADIAEIEFGAYNTWKTENFLLTNAYLSYGNYDFDIGAVSGSSAAAVAAKNTEFSAAALKLLIESQYAGKALPVNLSLALRAAYISSDKIDINGIEFYADNYYKAELLGGFAGSYRVLEFLNLGWKIYGGAVIAVSDEIPNVKSANQEFFGAKQSVFFGGAGIRGEIDMGDAAE